MNHTETLTYYVASFVDELVKNGVTDVVISPGSRSTPLALAFAENGNIQHWVNLDERSASFFALGMAKEQNKPVALLCTSGTAAANFYPAIVEAHYSRVPLIVLTADRPHELREVGAPQAIDQVKMYGHFVKWFQEMALPEATNEILAYVRSTAARAIFEANNRNAGPVHLNFPFREPLMLDFSLPDIWGVGHEEGYHHFFEGKREISLNEIKQILEPIKDCEKGLIVCGPQMDVSLREEIFALGKTWNIPVLADPLSQLRAGDTELPSLVEGYDSILKSEKIRAQLKPDFIIRFGGMPVSKPYLFFLKENNHIPHFVIEAEEGYREPTLTKTRFIYAEPKAFCRVSRTINLKMDSNWTNLWINMNATVKERLTVMSETLTEGHTVSIIEKGMEEGSILFTGNSMPVRDVDTFFMKTDKEVLIYGNRGANGIDGIVSSAIGTAAHGKKVTLLIGDLSFFHDLNGLLVAKHYNLDITVVLINNNGGGIFSFLSQANENNKHFEVLFGTPLDISFEKAIEMHGGNYTKVETWSGFEDSLKTAYQDGGVHVLEITTDRQENVAWHRQEWAAIEKNLLSILGEQ